MTIWQIVVIVVGVLVFSWVATQIFFALMFYMIFCGVSPAIEAFNKKREESK